MCQLQPSTWKGQIPEIYKVLHKVMAVFTNSHLINFTILDLVFFDHDQRIIDGLGWKGQLKVI